MDPERATRRAATRARRTRRCSPGSSGASCRDGSSGATTTSWRSSRSRPWVQAQVLVVPVAQVAVVVPVVSAEARRRSRVHGGVKSSTSFNHLRPRRTRRARRQYL